MATKTLERTKINVIFDFFNQFPKWCGKTAVTPTIDELEKYISKNLQMFNNGQIAARNSASYLERIKNFQKKYSNFQVSKPLEVPLIQENRVAIYYKLDLTTHTGQHKEVFVSGLITIENDKISRWVEVTNEHEAGHWDK